MNGRSTIFAMLPEISISEIHTHPLLLPQVKKLWRSNSSTLGYMPDEAFDGNSNKILVAHITSHKSLAGYVLYRVTRKRVVIAHLCVDDNFRGRGVAKTLFRGVVERTSKQPGIMVSCRSDFAANKMWPRLNFVQIDTRPGRGKNASELCVWWYEQDHHNLFTSYAKELSKSKISVVMDANILFDLDRNELRALPSHALQADWLRDFIELFVTEEIYTEIHRQDNPVERQRSLALADSFPKLPCPGPVSDTWRAAFRPYFPQNMNVRDESDLRQIARAAGGDADFFISRDEKLVARAVDIERETNMRILNPTEFITQIDELEREHAYQPARFIGSSLSLRRMHGADTDEIAQAMVIPDERLRDLRGRLRTWLASPQNFDGKLISINEKPAACFVTSFQSEQSPLFIVHLVRTVDNKQASTLMRQIVRQLLMKGVSLCANEILVLRDHLSLNAINALEFFGFNEVPEGWLKTNLYGCFTLEQGANKLRELSNFSTATSESFAYNECAQLMIDNGNGGWRSNEFFYWPAKFQDPTSTSYILPIRASWAAELFDYRLATLYGRSDKLALNVESVYYRSASGMKLQSPARILWYVSASKSFGSDSMSIRACSYLDEIAIGKPKELFRKFKRLGVYGWRDVIGTADGDINKDIAALRYSGTQLLRSPVKFNRIQEILPKKNNFQGPLAISPETFAAIYTEASK